MTSNIPHGLTNGVTVPIMRLAHGAGLPLPQYATAGAAGLDLLAAVDLTVVLAPGQHQMIPTGIAVGLPEGFEAQVRPRSGLAAKFGVTVLNSPGTIDADYRGEISVILINLGKATFDVTPGMRIAQMVIAPVTRATWAESDNLDETDRGAGGFGSTGLDGKTGPLTGTGGA